MEDNDLMYTLGADDAIMQERMSLRRQVGNLLAQYAKYGVISRQEMKDLDDYMKKELSRPMRRATCK